MIACVVRSRRWAARQWIEPCILSSRDHQGATDAIEWKDDGREEGSLPGYTRDRLRYQSRIRAVSTLLQSLLSEVHTRDLEQERQQDMIDSEALLGHQEYPVLSPIHLLMSPARFAFESSGERVRAITPSRRFKKASNFDLSFAMSFWKMLRSRCTVSCAVSAQARQQYQQLAPSPLDSRSEARS